MFSFQTFAFCGAALLGVAFPTRIARAQSASAPLRVSSPDGHLAVNFWLNPDGAPRYSVMSSAKSALLESQLGLVRDDADFSTGLRLVSAAPARLVRDRYQILTTKRHDNFYRANRRTFELQTASSQRMDIVFQVSDDGVAFRYVFPETSAQVRRINEEKSSFAMLPGARAWLQPISAAKGGWAQTYPAYEEHYSQNIAAGTPSPTGAGWVYPALFRAGNVWLLISESALGRHYCGTRLRAESPDGEYQIGFPDPRENFQNGPVNPQSSLPWRTPWRLIVVGSLKTIAESTLGTDLADAPTPQTTPSMQFAPGKAAWSWPLLGDESANFETQKQFIDYAARMNWRYCLIDALWDVQIGDEKLKQLCDYARAKNVKILVWYNSAGDWNTTPQTPRSKLLTRADRLREFERMKQLGVAGLKIDFFGGDGQSVINYYQDIMEDAAPYGLGLNFHGATLPRGWERTYPNLMTTEAIRGEEYITFGQGDIGRQPSHVAMLPFTRNVFDPMDFTPVVLDKLPHSQRRTTSGFELASSVLLTSGIQHYAEIPAGMEKAPLYVQNFLKNVPAIWEDSKFIAGFPGEFAVMARRSGNRWFVAGVNGQNTTQTVTLDLSELDGVSSGMLITDGSQGNLSFEKRAVKLSADQKLKVQMQPNGGFVVTLPR